MTSTDLSVESDDRAAWLEWRRQGVGASEIAVLCGLSPFASPWSLYLTKRGEIPEEDLSGNPMVELGRRAEGMLGDWFRDATGLHIIGEQTQVAHPEVDWQHATLDGYVVESPTSTIDDALGVAEIKVTGDGEWDEVPDHYACQVQWQMHVTGLGHAWLPVLHRHSGAFRVYEMERDDGVIAELVRLAGDFWQRIQSGTPPPIDGSAASTTALRAAYPQDDGEEVEVSAVLVEAWRIAKGRVDAAKLGLDAAENELKVALGDAAYGVVDGQRLASWRSQDRTGIDLARLKADHPDLAEMYRTVTSSRVLRYSKPKGEK